MIDTGVKSRRSIGKISVNLTKYILFFFILSSIAFTASGQSRSAPSRGYSTRLENYINELKVVDTHDHLLDPALVKNSTLTDFMLLLCHFCFNDFVSAGLDPMSYPLLIGDSLTVQEKWQILEPYWDITSNTAYFRTALLAADRLYGIPEINETTVGPLSAKIYDAYQTDWFRQVIVDKSNIEFLIQDGDELQVDGVKIYNIRMFASWLTINRKYAVDSLAVTQLKQIKTLENFVESLEIAVKKAVESGIVAIKINVAYSRPYNFEDVRMEAARKTFRALMDEPMAHRRTFAEMKPLQDYMLFRLLDLARKYKVPVAFHTGLMAGSRNSIKNADPTLLTNLFQKYPDVNFVLFHGSYPYGGELATIVKNFYNVYMDLSWIYAISPTYSERYLNEWLETVPAGKIMAFGGDAQSCENIYGELVVARQIITRVLSEKVRRGYFSEDEAKMVAKQILHDSAVRFYNLK